MTMAYKDFIGAYKDVYPEGYCKHLISEFDRLIESGAGHNRQESEDVAKHRKNDTQIGLNFGVHSVAEFNDAPVEKVFFDGLQKCYKAYADEFSVLRDGIIRGTAMKMQCTPSGGGYHIWHSEQGNGTHAERVLVYTLYLNTFGESDGGETEFLYQKTRIRPEENTLIIWPATFTHAHRGNMVLREQSKYIVTGWFYYE